MIPDLTIAPQWRDRFIAGAKVLLFGFLLLVALTVEAVACAGVGVMKSVHGFVSEESLGTVLLLSAAVLATLVMALVEKRDFWDYGFGGVRCFRLLSIGAVSGAVLLSLLILVLWLCNGLILGNNLTSPVSGFRSAFAYGFLFLSVALCESAISHGYALVTLSKAISFWPAAIVMSLFFGSCHIFNDNETVAGVLSTVAVSLVFCYSLFRLRSLWFAVGLHFTWDYGQSFVYGVPDSGIILPGSLLTAHITGAQWLTGGGAGPEGSVFIIVVLALLILIIRKTAETQPPIKPPPDPEIPPLLSDAAAFKD